MRYLNYTLFIWHHKFQQTFSQFNFDLNTVVNFNHLVVDVHMSALPTYSYLLCFNLLKRYKVLQLLSIYPKYKQPISPCPFPVL